MNIVFVAGGLNTRFEEYSIFPKILLPYKGNDSILIHNCELFHSYKKFLIINHQYYDMVKNYIEVNKLDITLIKSTNVNGSYQTIKSVKKLLPKEDLLFIWSDLILSKNPDVYFYENKNVIFTYPGEYRYKVTEDALYKVTDGSGNVPGIYYCKTLEDSEVNYEDLIDYIFMTDYKVYDLSKLGDFSIMEFRDKKVYLNYISAYNDEPQTRFFNKIEIKNNVFTKKAVDIKYAPLIFNETQWYLNVKEGFSPKLLPTTEDYSLSIEYLEGYITLEKYIKNTYDNNIIGDVLYKVKLLHKKKQPNKEFSLHKTIKDTKHEFYDKVIKRVESISPMLINYNKEEFRNLLNKSYKYIKHNNSKTYTFIHGDLNGSNILVNPKTKDIKFVDPRGYFGNTKLYGLAEYDYSKLLYCFSGYDDFNNSIKYLYSKVGYVSPFPLCEVNINDSMLNKNINQVILGLIWISLSSYISNNIMKVNIAYEHGMEILRDFWRIHD